MKMLGWQITHRDNDNPPPGMMTYEVFDYNTVMTVLANLNDRPEWRLLPVYEGDVDEPKVLRWNVKQALGFAHHLNTVPRPR